MERLLTNHIDELTLILDDYSSSNDLELAETRKKLKNKLFLNKIFKVISLVLIYVLLVIFSIVAIFPFYWMIITSLKNFQEVSLIPATFYPTYGVYFSNYIDVFTRFSFETYLLNTIIVIIISTLGTLLTTILTAFAFAKLEFKGRDTLFTIFLATMMIPSELFVITNFITCYRYGLLDIISIDPSYNPNYQIDNILNALKTYFAIMLPFIVNVFYIYLLRQNFKQVPNELYLASKVDGKSDCEVVIFDDEKFIRGPVNTEPNEYAYVIESEKIEYNNYDLTINIIDVNGNEEDGKIHIDVSDLNDGKISLKIENIDNKYSQYEFISDNEDDVFNYCQSN